MLNQFDDAHGLAPHTAPLGAVLIVEDDALLSMMMEQLVREMGARQIVVAANPAEAARALADTRFDCAILDVLTRDGSTYAIADALSAKGTPFIFCSGVQAEELEERHRHRPLLGKPYRDSDLQVYLRNALATGG